MSYDNDTEYQYDRCSSRGICSINPATAAFLEVILLYLKHAAYYELKLETLGHINNKIRNLIINTISILSSSYEISENNFRMIESAFKTELPLLIENFKKICKTEQILDTENIIDSCKNINDCIRYGEKEFNKKSNNISVEIMNLMRILFVLLKSFCINILTYESFNSKAEEEILSVLEILNFLNKENLQKSELKNLVNKTAKQDCLLMKKIRDIQEETYGKQEESEVSYSTRKGRAILVVGSNLRELEQILDIVSNSDIDVYTHDNMIIAHTFPKFRKYKNLKGQFGKGIENCLLDFSTFPGPIILTRNSLFNVENFYRGRLFTTDFSYTKGIIPIKNNDFSEVIKSANESKGFKTGKDCFSEIIGFDVEDTLRQINLKLSNNSFKNIIVIGNGIYSSEEKEYFKTFIKHMPEDMLMITLSCYYNKPKENIITLNGSVDTCLFLKLTEKILETNDKPIQIFIPYSERHTLSVFLYLNSFKNAKIHLGNWSKANITHNISNCLKNDFDISIISTPKKDLNEIIQ